MPIWRMRSVCWIPKATNAHSEYVIIIAFPLKQWLPERASCLVVGVTVFTAPYETELVYYISV
jgi:hypothetical protein